MFDYSENLRGAVLRPMDSKRKHPFAITCRGCGSNSVTVRAFDYHSLEIQCNCCGKILNCGSYVTDEYDYSEC